MIYVISEAGTILNKIDAWERNAEEKMLSQTVLTDHKAIAKYVNICYTML